MLVVVMQSSEEYLEFLGQLAKKRGIKDTTLGKKKGIGTEFIGPVENFVFPLGRTSGAYDGAFVAIVEGEEGRRRFRDLIEENEYLETLNVEDKGFICAVPFRYIKRLELKSSPTKKLHLLPKGLQGGRN